uniref:Uncharacterized protein n=1 Tax=Knipowitschia caucasica TaxID=637954 RepID=A0AAV2JFH3_KNICA
MDGSQVKSVRDKAGKTVRFRVASANSGRVLTEVFKDEAGWGRSVSHSGDSGSTGSTGSTGTDRDQDQDGVELPTSEANSHLNGLMEGSPADETGAEPDDLLLYASAKREMRFTNKRVNICSKNGTIRGVRNKVSAGQVLFNNLSHVYSGNPRQQKRRPWEKP